MSDVEYAQPHGRETVARVGGLMLIAGGSLSAILVTLDPGYTDGHDAPVAAIGAAAILLGGLTVLLPSRVPNIYLVLLPVIGASLICNSMMLSGTASNGAELLLIWPVLFSGYFLGRLASWLNATIVVTLYAWMAFTVAGSAALTPCVYTAGTSVMTLLIVSSLRDRLAKLLAESQLEARTDGLTGLLNRRAFDELSDHEVIRCRREGVPLALLLVDLDHFKRLNDTYGHPAGDTALRQIAGLLRSQARESDVLARFGGEEFAMLLPACPPVDAQRRADQLRILVEQASEGWVSPLTISVGVAVLPTHTDDLAGLVEAADTALYAAKSVGRNAVQVAPLPEPVLSPVSVDPYLLGLAAVPRPRHVRS